MRSFLWEGDYDIVYLAQSIGMLEDENGGSIFKPSWDAPEDEAIDKDGADNHIAIG